MKIHKIRKIHKIHEIHKMHKIHKIHDIHKILEIHKIRENVVLPSFNSSKIVLKRKHLLKTKWLYWTGLFDT